MQHQGRFLTQLHAFAAQLGTPRQGFEPGQAITPEEVTRIEQQRAAMLGVIYPS
jgi:hypothetical protein